MDDLVVTKLWMLGVIVVMVSYGIIAVAGILRNDNAADSTK